MDKRDGQLDAILLECLFGFTFLNPLNNGPSPLHFYWKMVLALVSPFVCVSFIEMEILASLLQSIVTERGHDVGCRTWYLFSADITLLNPSDGKKEHYVEGDGCASLCC